MVITIDGDCATGKSTIASLLAKRLGFRHISSGLIYRSIAWLAVNENIPLRDLTIEAPRLVDSFKLGFNENSTGVTLNGRFLSQELRSPQLTPYLRIIASDKDVIDTVEHVLHEEATKFSLVVDGRSAGVTTFPDATFRFVFRAKPLDRAKYHARTLDEVELLCKQFSERDEDDRLRGISDENSLGDALVVNPYVSSADVIADELASLVQSPEIGQSEENFIAYGKCRLADDKSQSGVLISGRLRMDNVFLLEGATCVLFAEPLLLTSHPTLIFRDMRIPYAFNTSVERVLEIADKDLEMTVLSVAGKVHLVAGKMNSISVPLGQVSAEAALCSSAVGMNYWSKNLVEVCAVRAEFVYLGALDVHPLEALRTGNISLYESKLAEVLSGGSGQFNRLMLRFSDFSQETLKHLRFCWDHESPEENPALGLRGCERLLSVHASILDIESQCLENARQEFGDIVQGLIPYARNQAESDEAYCLVRRKFAGRLGCMIETPNIAYGPISKSDLYDFFVIGASDLTQLFTGASRERPKRDGSTIQSLAVFLGTSFVANVPSDKTVYVPDRELKTLLERYAYPGQLKLLSK